MRSAEAKYLCLLVFGKLAVGSLTADHPRQNYDALLALADEAAHLESMRETQPHAWLRALDIVQQNITCPWRIDKIGQPEWRVQGCRSASASTAPSTTSSSRTSMGALAHRRARLVIAAALGVPFCELKSPRTAIY